MAVLDSTEELGRIASALESLGTPEFFQTSSGQITLLLIGLLVGAVVTHVLKSYEDNQERELKRQLLVALLGDEIVLRWDGLISQDFKANFTDFNIPNIERLCKTEFQPDDLHVFQKCAADMLLTTTFGDRAVVSTIIYVHILIRDFCDGITILRRSYKKFDGLNKRKASPSEISGIEQQLRGMWEDLRNKFEGINSQMGKIYLRIEADYDRYLRCSGFSSVPSDVRERLKKAAPDPRKARS